MYVRQVRLQHLTKTEKCTFIYETYITYYTSTLLFFNVFQPLSYSCFDLIGPTKLSKGLAVSVSIYGLTWNKTIEKQNCFRSRKIFIIFRSLLRFNILPTGIQCEDYLLGSGVQRATQSQQSRVICHPRVLDGRGTPVHNFMFVLLIFSIPTARTDFKIFAVGYRFIHIT